jgi:hypothetical protein
VDKVQVRDSVKSQSGTWIYYYTETEVITTKIDSILIPENIFKQSSKENGVFAYDAILSENANYMLKCIDKELPLKNIDKNDIDLLTAYLVDNSVFTEAWQYIAADIDRNKKIDINDLNLLIQYVKGDISILHADQWSLINWDSSIAQYKSDILTTAKSWNTYTNVTADINNVEFKMIQIGDLIKIVFDEDGNVTDIFNANQRSREESDLSLYPNPFTDRLILKVNSAIEQENEFILSDINGKIIDKTNFHLGIGDNILSYNGSHLQSGLYIYQLNSGNNVSTGKVIKSN